MATRIDTKFVNELSQKMKERWEVESEAALCGVQDDVRHLIESMNWSPREALAHAKRCQGLRRSNYGHDIHQINDDARVVLLGMTKDGVA